jgi:hypothetical protein
MTYDVNHWPDHCPHGHILGPGKGSMSWDMTIKRHVLLCGGCERRSRITLGEPGARWEVLIDTRWVPYEE